MPDEVRVIVDGRELRGWEACTLDMAVDHIADGISLDGPWDWTRKELRQAFRPDGLQPVQVYIDDDLYLTGRLERMQPKREPADRTINLSGRSLTGILADCSLTGDLEYHDLALSTICWQVCKPWPWLKVRADNDTDPIPEVRASYGQLAADFLNAIAAPRNILLNCSYKGELVLTWGNALPGRPPVARLLEGEYPVMAVDADYDMTKRFSLYQVASQFAGRPDIVDTAYDDDVPIYRPHRQAAAEAAQSPEDADALAALDMEEGDATGQTYSDVKAKMLKARMASRLRVAGLAAFASVNVSLTGWRRPDGLRWAERQIVTLLAPSAMVYREVPWLIAGCKLALSASGGRTTALRLVLPETYSGTMPKEAPWVS